MEHQLGRERIPMILFWQIETSWLTSFNAFNAFEDASSASAR